MKWWLIRHLGPGHHWPQNSMGPRWDLRQSGLSRSWPELGLGGSLTHLDMTMKHKHGTGRKLLGDLSLKRRYRARSMSSWTCLEGFTCNHLRVLYRIELHDSVGEQVREFRGALTRREEESIQRVPNCQESR